MIVILWILLKLELRYSQEWLLAARCSVNWELLMEYICCAAVVVAIESVTIVSVEEIPLVDDARPLAYS